MKRRIFLKNAAVVSAVTILKPGMAFSSRANSAIQIGIIGCGERGTAAVSQLAFHQGCWQVAENKDSISLTKE